MVDVFDCYVLCGVSALVGGSLTRLHANSLLGEDTRRVLWLYRIGFACLVPMIGLSLLDATQRQAAMPFLFAAAVSATALLAWALRELNGSRLPERLGAGAVLGSGLSVLAVGLGSTRGLVLGASAAFTVISGLLLVDQWGKARSRQRLSRAEHGLIAVLLAFLSLFLLILIRTLANPDAPLPAHGLFLPEPALSLAATVIAVMPLSLSALVFAVMNERLVHRLERVALTDELTGLLSRRGLRELGLPLIAAHQRRGGLIAVLMTDIDHFKRVNDTHGHAVGDQAIRHVADCLREQLRADALVTRYGGEEFTALVPIERVEDARVVGERVRASLESRPCASDAGTLKLTVSVGVAILSPADALEPTLNVADARLYEAKQAGRNRVVST